MINFKKILTLYFFAHITLILIIGFSSFSNLETNPDNKLNYVGQFIVEKARLYKSPKLLVDFIFFYSKYTGTNRGYSFFSPNVAPTKVTISFMSENKEVNLPFKTQEAKLKFGCANLHLNSHIFDKEEREIILKSLSSSLFSNNPDIKKLDIYLNIFKYPDLNTVKNTGYNVQNIKILAFSAINNRNYEKHN